MLWYAQFAWNKMPSVVHTLNIFNHTNTFMFYIYLSNNCLGLCFAAFVIGSRFFSRLSGGIARIIFIYFLIFLSFILLPFVITQTANYIHKHIATGLHTWKLPTIGRCKDNGVGIHIRIIESKRMMKRIWNIKWELNIL